MNCFEKNSKYFLFAFRIIIGFLFFSHGAQKLLGIFGGTAIATINLFWFAGLIEILVGLGIFFGVLTRIAAMGGAVQMLVAYFMIHSSWESIHPLTNGGELSLLFFTSFLVLTAFGGGIWTLEKAIFKKELV